MRLSQIEMDVIKTAIRERDGESLIYLFGSRVDDNAKGGDIDILVVSKRLKFADKLAIKARIFESLEEQKIDLIISPDTDDPFVRHAIQQGDQL